MRIVVIAGGSIPHGLRMCRHFGYTDNCCYDVAHITVESMFERSNVDDLASSGAQIRQCRTCRDNLSRSVAMLQHQRTLTWKCPSTMQNRCLQPTSPYEASPSPLHIISSAYLLHLLSIVITFVCAVDYSQDHRNDQRMFGEEILTIVDQQQTKNSRRNHREKCAV